MISRNDIILLLTDLEEHGVDVKAQLDKALATPNISLDILKFINDNRQLDLSKFYIKIRKSYNHKKSKLYGSIVKEVEEPSKILTTLSALLTQIVLYAETADDKQMFLDHSRAREISKALNTYFTTYDLTPCLKLLKLIKMDCKAIESLK